MHKRLFKQVVTIIHIHESVVHFLYFLLLFFRSLPAIALISMLKTLLQSLLLLMKREITAKTFSKTHIRLLRKCDLCVPYVKDVTARMANTLTVK